LSIFHVDLMLTVNRAAGYTLDETDKDRKKMRIYISSCSKNHDPLIKYLNNLVES